MRSPITIRATCAAQKSTFVLTHSGNGAKSGCTQRWGHHAHMGIRTTSEECDVVWHGSVAIEQATLGECMIASWNMQIFHRECQQGHICSMCRDTVKQDRQSGVVLRL